MAILRTTEETLTAAFTNEADHGTMGANDPTLPTRGDREAVSSLFDIAVSFPLDKFAHNIGFTCAAHYDDMMIDELSNTDYYSSLPDVLSQESVAYVALPRFLKQTAIVPYIAFDASATPDNIRKVGTIHAMWKVKKDKQQFVIAESLSLYPITAKSSGLHQLRGE